MLGSADKGWRDAISDAGPQIWDLMIEKGARAFRYKNTTSSAMDIVAYILGHRGQPVVMHIQDELAGAKVLAKTTAAHALQSQLQNQLSNSMTHIEYVKKRLEQARRDGDQGRTVKDHEISQASREIAVRNADQKLEGPQDIDP